MSEPRPHRCPGPQPFLPRSRREFLKVAGCGFGLLGLADLLGREARAGDPAARSAAKTGHLPGQGQALHLPVHDRRSEPDGPVRPQAAPEPARRAAAAAQLRQDPQPVPRGRPALPGQPPQVGQVRPVGDGHVGPGPAPAPACRRHRADPLVLRRQRDPRPGDVPDEHRTGDHGLPQPGELGHLRPGLRERRPAGLRRDDPARGDARRGRTVLGGGLPAGPSPGNALPQRAGADRQPQAARGSLDSRTARHARPAAVDERAGPRPGRHRALGADRDLRAGLPDAERGARGGRPLAASRRRPRRSTASTIRGPSSSAPAACWRAGWSSAASGSSSSIPAAARSPCSGTPTTTSTPTTRRCAA